jgi:hypothetical protein
MKRRVIRFAGSGVAVEYQGRRAEAIVAFVFRYVRPAAGEAPHRTLRLISDDVGGEFCLFEGDDTEPRRTTSEGWMAEYLLGRTCYHLAYWSQSGLLFHAGGVSWEGRGLLLPGSIGAGKTTLTAWLLGRGFRYLTDELVYVPEGADSFQAFTRPLNVKGGARVALEPLLGAVRSEGRCDRTFYGPDGELVPPEQLSPHPPHSEAPLHLIVFPRFQPAGELDLERLSQAQAGLALMACLINARNLDDHGFGEVVRLARSVPAYRLRYGGFRQLEGILGEMGCE